MDNAKLFLISIILSNNIDIEAHHIVVYYNILKVLYLFVYFIKNFIIFIY